MALGGNHLTGMCSIIHAMTLPAQLHSLSRSDVCPRRNFAGKMVAI